MKKRIIYFSIIIFCLPNVFVLYKTFDMLNHLDSLEKKTGWVKGVHYYRSKRAKNLDIYLASEQEVKQMIEPSTEGKADIHVWIRKYSFIDLPEIKFRDKITYYEIEDNFVQMTNFSDKRHIIGVSTEKNPAGGYYLFADIMKFYLTTSYIIIFFLYIYLFCFHDKIFKTEKYILPMLIPFLFYFIIILII